MSDKTIVLPGVTKRIIGGQRFTQARLARDGKRVLCGFKVCDAELARLLDRGAYRELIISPGWNTNDGGIHWEFTTYSEKRAPRGYRPKARRGYVTPTRERGEDGPIPVHLEAWRSTPDGLVRMSDAEARAPIQQWAFVRRACYLPCWKHPRDHGINYLDPAVLGFITELEYVDLFISSATSDEERTLHLAYRAQLLAKKTS